MTSSSWKTSFPSIPLDEIKNEEGSLPFHFEKAKVLGQGGEAIVYLGSLYIAQKKTLVAVKCLYPYVTTFEDEIQMMQKIRHPNTVSLLGYCNQSGNKILIYEYMEKGSLSKYIKGKRAISLSWQQRLNICLGAARGLRYLHTETDDYPKGIVHRDIKPENILVDDNWVGKISDFGMVKLSQAGQQKSMMTTNIKGTIGYYAPEYMQFHSVTRKIDVYAFGVVLFEVLCLKSPWDRGDMSYFRRESEDLGLYAQQNIDTRIEKEISDDSLKIYTDIIQRSLQIDPDLRPSMEIVVFKLEKALKCQNLHDEAKLPKAPRFHEDDVPKNCPPGGEGKVVLYTSVGAIRKTNVACNAVKEILGDYHVEFEERDSSQDPNFTGELKKLVGTLTYPRLFVMGREIGLDNLHENDQFFKSILAIKSN